MILSDTIGIVASNSIAYIEAVFSALDDGKIVVPLREKNDKQRIEATSIEEVITPSANKKGWFSLSFTPPTSDDELNRPAQISFTSGTEGAPKGVVLSHRALKDVIDRLQMTTDVDNSIREYIGVPVYHSFGYGRCRLIATNNGKGFIPENGFNPKEIATMLSNGEINALSAVPSMLRILLSYKTLFDDSRLNLKWIEIGSQPMSAEEKAELRTLFPNACIVQHYGLTEASRTSLLRVDQASDEQLGSVGQAVGLTQIKIGDDGRINIKGAHLASGLLIDGELVSLPGEDGWFATSDLGRCQSDSLFFEGRADNLINCGGQKISSELIEKELTQQLGLPKGVAAVRVADETYGEAVLLCIENELKDQQESIESTAREIMAGAGISASSALKIYHCESLPVTDTGKVQRRSLAEDYLNSVKLSSSEEQAEIDDSAPTIERIKHAFINKLKLNSVDDSHTFTSLGGDSIAAVGLSIELEMILGDLPHQWRTMNLNELAESAVQGDIAESDDGDDALPLGSVDRNPKGIEFWSLVKEDFVTHESDFFSQGFWAVFNNRFGNWRMSVQSKILRIPLTILYRIQTKMIQIFCGIKLDYTVRLGRRVKLEHFGGMILGARSIGDDVTIRQNTTFGIKDLSDLQGKPTIEKGVNIGAGAVLVGDIVVGRYSVIGPNAVLDKSVPPFSIVSAPESIVVTQSLEKEP